MQAAYSALMIEKRYWTHFCNIASTEETAGNMSPTTNKTKMIIVINKLRINYDLYKSETLRIIPIIDFYGIATGYAKKKSGWCRSCE